VGAAAAAAGRGTLLVLLAWELSGEELKGVNGVGGTEGVVVSGRRRCGLVVRRDMVAAVFRGGAAKLGKERVWRRCTMCT
jgi:hypothetical protein